LLPTYILTLSTLAAARVANTSTSWALARRGKEGILATGVSADDPHGDRARVDGRAVARKHANSVGHRFVLSDVQVRYDRQPPVTPVPPVIPR
jgi:hypothetical protein